eukprot:16433550-Heterocapsa_arctica.AAC.6
MRDLREGVGSGWDPCVLAAANWLQYPKPRALEVPRCQVSASKLLTPVPERRRGQVPGPVSWDPRFSWRKGCWPDSSQGAFVPLPQGSNLKRTWRRT